MAFDAGFTAAVVEELSSQLLNARIEKIFQPSRDSVLLVLRRERSSLDPAGEKSVGCKLLIDAGAANPRLTLSDPEFDNPRVPPMFCMLLRKHLGGARITGLRTLGFERAAELEFEARDELGFLSKKYLYAEIMGKFSNLIFCGADRRILAAVKTNDLSSGSKRPILPGIPYAPPPPQEGKRSPLEEEKEAFLSALRESALSPAKFLLSLYSGFSPLLAREIAFRAGESGGALWEEFSAVVERIKKKDFLPVLLRTPEGEPFEYSFLPILQYGNGAVSSLCGSFSELIETFFSERAKNERLRQRAADILRLLNGAENRLNKKIALQEQDLAACAEKETYKKYGDLITSSIYQLSRGMTEASLPDYSSEDCREVSVPLDSRLSPAQNAQKYYKKYAKCKSAEKNLTVQISLARAELAYLETVSDSLTRAESENDLAEIRRELYESGYASRMKTYSAVKIPTPKPMEFLTSHGYRVLCGKNNSQNDFLTHRLAGKNDLWFHVKGIPGSHVVLFCDGEEPPAEDFTQAAVIAAVYSKAPRGQKVAVDYTRVKNLKKPPASKPGFVVFSSNYTAFVLPDPALAERLRKK